VTKIAIAMAALLVAGQAIAQDITLDGVARSVSLKAVRNRARGPTQCGTTVVTTRCTKGGCKLDIGPGMPGAGLSRRRPRKAPLGKPAFQPYWGRPFAPVQPKKSRSGDLVLPWCFPIGSHPRLQKLRPKIILKNHDDIGAARGIRTPDPIITNDVLYRLSYCGLRAGEVLR
jgi:hypothetical protein